MLVHDPVPREHIQPRPEPALVSLERSEPPDRPKECLTDDVLRIGGATGARVYAAAIVGVFALALTLDDKTAVFVLGALFWIVAAPIWMWRGVKTEHRGALIATGFVVLVPAALAKVVLRPTEALLVLAVAWIADTRA